MVWQRETWCLADEEGLNSNRKWQFIARKTRGKPPPPDVQLQLWRHGCRNVSFYLGTTAPRFSLQLEMDHLRGVRSSLLYGGQGQKKGGVFKSVVPNLFSSTVRFHIRKYILRTGLGGENGRLSSSFKQIQFKGNV